MCRQRCEARGTDLREPLGHSSQNAPAPDPGKLDIASSQGLHDMGFADDGAKARWDDDADIPALSALVDVLVVGHSPGLTKRVP